MTVTSFGRLPDGSEISEIRLANDAGATASILTFGAALRDLVVPARDGPRRVVLGYRDLDGYLDNRRFVGVTVGRHASRIAGGRLPIGDTVHQLSLNDGPHHLHGGVTGFARKPWTIVAAERASVTLGLVSPDGDDGYPGRLDVTCTYRLLEPATLAIEMVATADATTVVSLAHHSYFTLTPGKPIRDLLLRVDADRITPFGDDMLPSGELAPVAGTPYDFRALRPIAEGGVQYDCNFVLNHPGDGSPIASLVAPDRSLAMELATSEPCLVFYDGAGLGGPAPALDGAPLFPFAGLCLEPMRFPDNPNQPAFPSARLEPGETYRQVTEYRFVG
jgi:aldose 1-epimerase